MRPSRSGDRALRSSRRRFMSCVTIRTVAAEAGVEVADEREDLVAGLRVEIAGRLVGEQDRRIDRQRARDGDALALAARQLVGQMRRGGGRAAPGAAARGRARRPSCRGQPRRCSGRPTFSRHDSVGSRLKNWKMKPILSRRTRVSSSSDRPARRSPSMRTSPEVGRSRPPMRLSSVDLPEPDGPTIDTISPRGIRDGHVRAPSTWRLPSKSWRRR